MLAIVFMPIQASPSQTIIAEASRMSHPMKMPIVRLIRTNLLIRWTMVQYIWIRTDAHDTDTDNRYPRTTLNLAQNALCGVFLSYLTIHSQQ